MIEIFKGNWTINTVKSQPQKIFIFGDNYERIGRGGQAIIRDCENTIGLRTKMSPGRNFDDYFTDENYSENIKFIDEDLIYIKNLEETGTIVLSEGGYGTGLSELPKRAPLTYLYLCYRLALLFKFNNYTIPIEEPNLKKILSL